MLESLLFYQIFLIYLSVGIASSYDEKTVYTQALLTISKRPLNNNVDHQTIKLSGKFGIQSLKKKVSGYLYHTGDDTNLWCQKFATPPLVNFQPWIALIPRGNCSYSRKIKLAKKYNASAVIIFNNKEEGGIPDMKDQVEDAVSVMISTDNGITLAKLVANKDKYKTYCEIVVGTHFVDRRWKVSRTSVLFVLVSFILLMCISLAWLVFYYVQRFRHIYRNDRKEKQLLTAAKKAISKLRMISYHTENREEEDEACAVCLENYKEGENLRILPCKHEYHKSCIDPWLLNHRTCPMCKSNILKSLGVDIPDNMSLSEQNIESRDEGDRQPERNASASAEEPTSSTTTNTGLPPSNAWSEQPVVATRYSSTSSISDTDSDRSTVALVSPVQNV